jgi:calcium-dependent protein kinase
MEILGLKKPKPTKCEEAPDHIAETIFQQHQGSFGKTKLNLIQQHGQNFADAQIAKMNKEAHEFMGKYELGKRLSAGAQGVTYLATDKKTGQTVVVKKPNDPAETADFDTLVEKSHPNVVRVFSIFHNPLDTYIVMECCSGGDLFGALEGLDTVTQNWAAAMFLQVIKGIHYLHEQFRECHNDIKPENILLEKKPTSHMDYPRAMIGDFGCIAAINTINQDMGGGDPRYRAPEIWRGGLFGTQSDVWSCGVTLFEIVTGGNLPYVNEPNIGGWSNFCEYQGGYLMQQYISCLQAGYPVDLSQFSMYRRLPNILGQFLDVRPQTRIRLADAFEHPWFELGQQGAAEAPLGEGVREQLQNRAAKNALHIFLLDMIGRRLQGESLNYYRDIWNQYDTDNSGTLDFPEFSEMVEDNGLAEGGMSASQLFQMADTSGTGTVSFNEFVALMFNPDELDHDEKLRYFASVFNDIAGADGQIEFYELAEQFPEVDRNQVMSFFQILDEDGNGTIDIDEFRRYLETM